MASNPVARRCAGRSKLGAAGASGITRIGMQKARSLESEITDRHRSERDKALDLAWRFLLKKPAHGDWLEVNPYTRVRPLAGMVLAQRRDPYETARSIGLHIPDIARYHAGQQVAALFDVIAVAENVKSVTPGDVVVAYASIGTWAGQFGPDCYLLRAPEYECRATTEDLSTDIVWDPDRPGEKKTVRREPNEHYSVRGRADGCHCGGHIDAILESDFRIYGK